MTEHNPLNSSNSPNSQSNSTPVAFSPVTGFLYAPFLVWKGLRYETSNGVPAAYSPSRKNAWDFDPGWRWGAFPGQVGSHSLRADVQSLGDEELSRRGIHGAAYSVAYRYSQSVFLCLVGGDVWEHDRGVRTTFMRTLGAHPVSTLGDLLVACWHIVESARHGYAQVEEVIQEAEETVCFLGALIGYEMGFEIEDYSADALMRQPWLRQIVSDLAKTFGTPEERNCSEDDQHAFSATPFLHDYWDVIVSQYVFLIEEFGDFVETHSHALQCLDELGFSIQQKRAFNARVQTFFNTLFGYVLPSGSALAAIEEIPPLGEIPGYSDLIEEFTDIIFAELRFHVGSEIRVEYRGDLDAYVEAKLAEGDKYRVVPLHRCKDSGQLYTVHGDAVEGGIVFHSRKKAFADIPPLACMRGISDVRNYADRAHLQEHEANVLGLVLGYQEARVRRFFASAAVVVATVDVDDWKGASDVRAFFQAHIENIHSDDFVDVPKIRAVRELLDGFETLDQASQEKYQDVLDILVLQLAQYEYDRSKTEKHYYLAPEFAAALDKLLDAAWGVVPPVIFQKPNKVAFSLPDGTRGRVFTPYVSFMPYCEACHQVSLTRSALAKFPSHFFVPYFNIALKMQYSGTEREDDDYTKYPTFFYFEFLQYDVAGELEVEPPSWEEVFSFYEALRVGDLETVVETLVHRTASQQLEKENDPRMVDYVLTVASLFLAAMKNQLRGGQDD